MATLHGSWLVRPDRSGFFLWGEAWRNLTTAPQPQNDESIAPHPFAIDRSAIAAQLDGRGIDFDLADCPASTQILTLPSRRPTKADSPIPLLSSQLDGDRSAVGAKGKTLQYCDWAVEGVWLDGRQAIALLRQLPIGSWQDAAHLWGDDLRYWTHLYRWSLDVLVRGKFLPHVSQVKDRYYSQWCPLLDSIADQTRFAKFTQQMPPACRSVRSPDAPDAPVLAQDLVLDFLRAIVAAQIREWIGSIPLPPKADLVRDWLQGLSSAEPAPLAA